jgi:Zn-dependent protease
MTGPRLRLGRIAGIPVFISPWWLLIVALFSWALGRTYYPDVIHGVGGTEAYALGLASVLLLFASVLAHEFGHAIVARRRGVVVEEIDLWLLGGVSRMGSQPENAADEHAYSLAGPLVTAGLVAVFGVLALVTAPSATVLHALLVYQFEANALLFVFNLLPAFPLDGGRILRAWLWGRRGDLLSATRTAAGVGRGFGIALAAWGLLLVLEGVFSGLWLTLIGWFLVAAARAERDQEEVTAAFTGVRVRELMSAPAECLSSELTLAQARDRFVSRRYSAFPVIDRGGLAVGLLTIEALEHAASSDLERTLVGERADEDPGLFLSPDADVARLLESPAFARVGRAVVLDAAGRPIGLVSRTDVQRAIRARRVGSSAGRRAA